MNNLNLQNAKQRLEDLRIEARKLNEQITKNIETWIKLKTDISVSVQGTVTYDYFYRTKKSMMTLKYAEIKVLDSNNQPVFGCDFTISWTEDGTITSNIGTCGEFTVLGENQSESEKTRVETYRLYAFMLQNANAAEFHNNMSTYDYSVIKEYNDLYYEVERLEDEIRREAEQKRLEVIQSQIAVGAEFTETNIGATLTITKITPKRVYYTIIRKSGYSFSDLINKDEFISKIRFEEIIKK